MELAIVLGILTFVAVTACTAMGVLHDHQSPAALLLGAAAAAWVAIPCLNRGQVERENVMRPVPRRYPIAWKFAFAKVREIFARANYRTGTSRWNVGTADTQSRHIHATMHFTDEKGHLEGAPMSGIRWKTELAHRFVEVDVQFFDHGDDCVVQLDFNAQTESVFDYRDADFAIEDIKRAVERELGPGTPMAQSPTFVFEPPPWWLLGLTGVALFSYSSAVLGMLLQK